MPDTNFKPDDVQERFSSLMFSNRENGVIHNPYDEEQREMDAIEQGDIGRLEESIGEDYPGKVGTLARDPVRHAKNLAIVVITLASRAAIRGGIDPETAFSLSDSYIQNAEEMHTAESLDHLMRHAEHQYAQMVRDTKERAAQRLSSGTGMHNPHADECRTYIVSHLHDKLTAGGIADALGMNANYLSELFSRQEHMTISEFILEERIRVAKDLLVYSGYSCGDIAEYLCFSSQSHFGDRFRKATGMTPNEFRAKFGRKEQPGSSAQF